MTVFIQVALAFTSLAIISRLSKYFKSFFLPFYILMGIALGPLVLGWTTNQEIFKLLGELGRVFLMFYLGYEFSLSRIL
ncbi:MAG: cation:proton antiporter [Candidatus Izimaplasma sp.]|nr:cation:proton antiporter [Candidatus Izimaplasma bacterium]